MTALNVPCPFAALMLVHFSVPVAYSMIFHRNKSTSFTYAQFGEDWNGTCQDGQLQSPIHIMTKDSILDEEAQPLVFVNYDQATLDVELKEHTIKFDPIPMADGIKVGIAGGGLMGFYRLDHIHLHWSSSEHAIDHYSYKMEAHLVHFKTPHGNVTADEAIDEPDGIAVIAVLFKWGKANVLLDEMMTKLGSNQTTASIQFMPKDFLPRSTDQYIRYRGSLTTPPCTEVVVWTIFTRPKTVAQYQVNWLRGRKLLNGFPVPENFRERQPVNERPIAVMDASYNYVSQFPRRSSAPAPIQPTPVVLLAAAILPLTFLWSFHFS